MKNLLILPGNSKQNLEWGESCRSAFADMFDRVECVVYDHWSSGEQFIDLETEMTKVSCIIGDAPESEDWYIFAKSIGSVLTLLLVQRGVMVPAKCIFFGMPLQIASQGFFKDDWSALQEYRVPTLAFHNDNDFTANYSFTKTKLDEFASTIRLKTLHGDTHDYLDFDMYRDSITLFLK